MKDLIFCGQYLFPNNHPAAYRELGTAMALKHAGWNCRFAVEPSPDVRDAPPEQVKGIPYHPLDSDLSRIKPGLGAGWRGWMAGGSALKSYVGSLRDDSALVLAGGYWPWLSKIQPLCKERGIRLILDVMEWMVPQQFPYGRLNPKVWSMEAAMRMRCPKADGVISISSFLHKYFTDQGTRSIQMPPLVDMDDPKWQGHAEPEDERIHLGYAGSPGRKDLLAVALGAMLCLSPAERERLVWHIIGTDEPDLKAMLTAAGIPQEDVMPFVRCYGRVAHEKALKVVAGCSYTVLLRPLNRTSQAGFPTKVVESASLGVPVIANATSDIFDCLELNEQAFLVDEPTSKSLAVTLASLIARGSGFAWGLRGSVRAAARSRFDYRSRSSELSDFMLQATS